MSRHSKNNTASAVFTAHERGLLKYGTVSERIGKDSIKVFDACSLCIHSVVEPMCCDKGHLFCKECIYSYLLEQKKEISRQEELWKRQEERLKDEAEKKEMEAKMKQIEEFERATTEIVSKSDNSGTKTKERSFVSEPEREVKKAKLTSFWVPGVREEAAPSLMAKPQSEPLCPEDPHPLKLKNLMKLNFTKNPEAEGNGKAEKFQCPSCCKSLTNATKAVALTKCGHVLCQGCFDTVKGDKNCFVCGKAFKEKNTMKLSTGGTGYSESSGEKLKPKIYSPSMT